MKLAMTLGFVLLSAAMISGCKKQKDPTGSASQAAGQQKMSIEEVFGIEEAAGFSNELGFYLVTKAGDSGFKKLNSTEQVHAAIWELEAEVNNGGFNQYFLNSAGDHSAEALSGLETVGASKMAELLRKAMSAFPGGKPAADRDARSKQVSALPPSAVKLWSELGGTFCDYPENLADLVMKHARANRNDFK